MPSCPFCAEEIPRTSSVCPFCNSELGQTRSAENRSKPKSSQNTWIVVIAIVGIVLFGCSGVLVALLLPAVQQARMAARRSMSKNNMKQIGLAMHIYHDANRTFPVGGTFDESGHGQHGWLTSLLPYMEQAHLFNSIDFDKPWDDPANASVFRNTISPYINPAITETTDISGFGLAHYAGNSLALSPNEPLQIREITDGTSNTIMGGEVNADFQPWGSPENVRDPSLGINVAPNGFGSPFVGGAHFLLFDGSVRFVNENIDPSILKALSTKDAGEVIGEF